MSADKALLSAWNSALSVVRPPLLGKPSAIVIFHRSPGLSLGSIGQSLDSAFHHWDIFQLLARQPRRQTLLLVSQPQLGNVGRAFGCRNTTYGPL